MSAPASAAPAFGPTFAARLAQFVTTDKSQITSLTILAEEHKDKATEVVAGIENALRARATGDESTLR